MRVGSRVNGLPYQIQYAIRRASGALGGWTTQTNSTVDVVSSNNSRVTSGSNGLASTTINVSVERNASDLRPGDSICWRFVVGDARGDLRVDGTPVNPDGNREDINCSLAVVNWPYLKVLGNDVVAGGSFGCGSPTPASIRGYMRSGSGLVGIGGSAQLAVFATNTISGFTSVGLRQGQATPATHAPPPYGLTFSNSSVPYGGNYSANDGITCLPDYFAMMPPAPTTTMYGNLYFPNLLLAIQPPSYGKC